ncbi:MAG: FAD-binding oxidoreductase [Actinomycetes bacterium]
MVAVLDTLRKSCAGHAREGEDSDAVVGARPAYVAAPGDTSETADVMRAAVEHGLRVVPRGAATKLDWGGAPDAVDLVVDTSRMDTVVEHVAGDLVVHVQAGVTLAALGDRLAGSGQRLALDPPFPAATIGGTVATGTSGPLRLLYGGPRDLVIGTTIVRADGVVARSGGKVVKNVAGYDLGKLLTGSFGTLGVLTECVLRCHPRPPARRWLLRECGSADAAAEVVRSVRRSQLSPSALEVDRPDRGGPLSVAVLLEGTGEGVAGRVAGLAEDGWVEDGPPAWWGEHPVVRDGTAVKITFAMSALGPVLAAVDELAPPATVVRGQAGSGVLTLGLPPEADAAGVAGLVTGLRGFVPSYDGVVVVLHAPPAVRAALGDVWGPVKGLELMRRVKEQFDPGRRLAPGRFVGGI